jgi:hypothetical protein
MIIANKCLLPVNFYHFIIINSQPYDKYHVYKYGTFMDYSTKPADGL